MGACSGHACTVLRDAFARRDSDLERLFRAATRFSHRDADFSSRTAFLDPKFHPAHRCDGGRPRRAIPDHGTSLDLHSANDIHPIALHCEFCELSHHTQDSLAGYGIRIDRPGANANRSVLKLTIAGG